MPDGERRTTTNYIPREATPEELRASFAQMWLKETDLHYETCPRQGDCDWCFGIDSMIEGTGLTS